MQSQEDDDPLSSSYSLNDLDESQLFDGDYDTFIRKQSRLLKIFNDEEREKRKNAENQKPSTDETK